MRGDSLRLKAQNLDGHYGPLRVLHGVSFEVNENEILVVMGPNGAGKSTLLGCISGQVRNTGAISVCGQHIEGIAAHARPSHGIALVPTGRGLFPEMKVSENLALGARVLPRKQRAESLRSVLTTFPFLGQRLRQKAGSLSGGEQQMLAIGKALAARPSILLLDEPTQGLAPAARSELADILRHLRPKLSIVLVEQNHAFATQVADRYMVLSGGRVSATGDRASLADRQALMRAYTA